MGKPDPIPSDIADALSVVRPRLGVCAASFWWHDEATSTNDLAGAHAEGGAPEGTVVVANTQRAGRGRLGRSWASPAGAGLYASVVFRPRLDIVPLVTIAAGVALAEGIEAATGLQPSLKWPNDVYLTARKVAGILAEGGSDGSGLQYVVLGFGINVLSASYPPDVAARATCIEQELGRRCDRGLILAECLAALVERYRDLSDGRAAALLSAWRLRAAGSLGRPVEWEAAGTTRRGIARDIDSTGALLVQMDRDVVPVVSGEVRWLS